MIVKISDAGTSFKGLSQYLTHDPHARSVERVDWTHTQNLANDDIPSAVNEMYLTAENAEALKQQAGIRAGGRSTERAVKHVSLNWAPDDNPSRDHMIKTSEDFLKSMGWDERQAIFVAHNDRPHKHVHIMVNSVHPETGLALDHGFEHRRAQKWALGYELQQDRVHCKQRLEDPANRENSMPRNIWVEFQKNEQEFIRSEEKLVSGNEAPTENLKNSEWQILKEVQQSERKEFFAHGKIEFSDLRASIYREVRAEFREGRAGYYEARKNGADTEVLAEMKSSLIADQKASLEPRRDQAFLELRQTRDEEYRGILDQQQKIRDELKWRQNAGLDNAEFLSSLVTARDKAGLMEPTFQDVARDVSDRPNAIRDTPGQVERRADEGTTANTHEPAYQGFRSIGHGVGSLLDSLFFDLTTLGESKREPVPRAEREDGFRQAAEEATKQHQASEQEADDIDWRKRQRAFGE